VGEFDKLKAIVAREFMERVRTKWFVIITLLGPVLLSALLFLPVWLATRDGAGATAGRVVVLDASGEGLGERVRQQLAVPGQALPPVLARSSGAVPIEVRIVLPDGLAAAESIATREVITKQAAGYLVLPRGSLVGDSARYAGRNATSFADVARLSNAVRQAMLGTRLERAGVPAKQAHDLLRPRAGLRTERLTERGRGGSGEANVAFALGVSFLLYMAIVLYGQNVMRGVLEEKQTRVAEVVVSSVRPATLLAGKVLGVGAVGLVQIGVWIAGTFFASAQAAPLLARRAPGGPGAGVAPITAAFDFAPGTAAAVLLFFVLGYTFYSSLYAAAGAMVNSEQEAQQMVQPLILPLVATALLIQPVVLNPTGPLARAASLVPLSAPVIMPLRMALTPVPWSEVLLAALSTALACAGAVWLAARIYRVGLLMYGKRPTVRELARWVRQSA
jgi:ABC-2 type transport system permease protein